MHLMIKEINSITTGEADDLQDHPLPLPFLS